MTAPHSRRHEFSKALRLLKRADFDRVFASRCSRSDDQMVVYGVRNELAVSRLGLVVSKKCGNAVQRNRWKRVLREAFRLEQHSLPVGIDLVILPRPNATPATEAASQSLRKLSTWIARSLPGPASKSLDG